MRRTILPSLLFSLAIIGCGGDAENKKPNTETLSEEDFQKNYVAMVKRIQAAPKKTTIEKIPAYLETCLRDSMFEYWYGTRWGFYGTSPKPRQGKIACGYFVTTTLKHLGLNINHIYLAQQASSVLIKEVCDKNSIKIFTNSRFEKMLAYVKQYPGQIFIVGLDNHVGYMVKQKDDMYFVHSGGGRPLCVIKEKAEIANHLQWSKYHMVGHINFAHWAKGLKGN
ncbi:MAG: hypothetical protein ACHQF2_09855 [Flavobacteriales bacterium]